MKKIFLHKFNIFIIQGKLTQIEQEEIEILKRIRTTTQVHKASKNNFKNFKNIIYF